MSTLNYVPVNEFTARGVIDRIEKSPYGGLTVTLIIKERRSLLKLSISVEPGIAKRFGKKDRVTVKGYTKGFSYFNEPLNRQTSVMYFVATSIEKDKPELATRFGKDVGIFYPEPYFRAYVCGKVTKIDPPSKTSWARITVETCGGGRDLRPSYVVLRYFASGRLPLFDYEPGDIVCASLSAYTPEKEIKQGKRTQTRIYQNLIVEDMAYLEKKPRTEAAEETKEKEPAKPAEAVIDEQQIMDLLSQDAESVPLDDSALMGD